MSSKAKSSSTLKTGKSSKLNSADELPPLSPLHQKMFDRQNKYIKTLREARYADRRPLTQDEVKEIGRAIGLWTAEGKLTASYKMKSDAVIVYHGCDFETGVPPYRKKVR